MMGFNYPHLLVFLLAVPAVMALCYISSRLRKEARTAYGQASLLDRYLKAPTGVNEWFAAAAWVVAATLLAMAAAGPYLMNSPERVSDGSLQVVVTLDVSKSMLAEDYRATMPDETGNIPTEEVVGPWGSRLDMAKYQIEQIMKQVQGSQVGIVNYMGEGFPQADLTTDFTSLRFVLKNWVKVGNAPGGGSNFAHGLKEAIRTLKRDEDPTKQKIIVLFSDGGFTGEKEELDKIIEEIIDQKIRLVIVGIGTPGANAIPIYQDNQLKGYVTKEGKPVTSSYEDEILREIVARTGAQYQHVEADSSSHQLNVDWRSTLGGYRVEVRQSPIFHWFVSGAGVLLLLMYLLGFVFSKRRAK